MSQRQRNTNCELLLYATLLLLQAVAVRMLPAATYPYHGNESQPRSSHICGPHESQYIDSKCSDAQTGRELFIGEAFTRPGQCVRVQCLGTLQLWEDHCQEPKLQGNCTSLPSPNEYLNYPQCCPMYECKTYESNENGETEETRTYDQYGTLRKTHITQIFVISDPIKGTIPGQGVKTQFEI